MQSAATTGLLHKQTGESLICNCNAYFNTASTPPALTSSLIPPLATTHAAHVSLGRATGGWLVAVLSSAFLLRDEGKAKVLGERMAE